MTRKDYVQLAEELALNLRHIDSMIIGNDSESAQIAGFKLAVECMCSAMKRDNLRFDKEKFMKAVGL
jgi:hypothetical protein